jgi:hypothetical protein
VHGVTPCLMAFPRSVHEVLASLGPRAPRRGVALRRSTLLGAALDSRLCGGLDLNKGGGPRVSLVPRRGFV